jgi:hypothetical protein
MSSAQGGKLSKFPVKVYPESVISLDIIYGPVGQPIKLGICSRIVAKSQHTRETRGQPHRVGDGAKQSIAALQYLRAQYQGTSQKSWMSFMVAGNIFVLCQATSGTVISQLEMRLHTQPNDHRFPSSRQMAFINRLDW